MCTHSEAHHVAVKNVQSQDICFIHSLRYISLTYTVSDICIIPIIHRYPEHTQSQICYTPDNTIALITHVTYKNSIVFMQVIGSVPCWKESKHFINN